MNQRILVLLILLTPLLTGAQQPGPYADTSAPAKPDSVHRKAPADSIVYKSPYNPKGNIYTWSLKGKILPFILGNGGGVSGFLGAEYGFLKNQSIGLDGYVLLTENSHDFVRDTAGVQHDVGAYSYSTEKAFMIDYRYYFNFPGLRKNKGLILYTLAFLRYGTVYKHRDPLYEISKGDYLQQWEIHRSAGLMLGASGILSNNGRLGLDANIGMFMKDKTTTTLYRDSTATRTLASKSIYPGLRLSVNVCYWFYRQRPRPPRKPKLPRPKSPKPAPRKPAPWSRDRSTSPNSY